MKKALAILGLSTTIAFSSPLSGNALTEESDAFLRPPYPQASIFAVLMPEQGQCRIALLREGAGDYLFPGTSTTEIANLVYLLVETKVHLKNGKTVPVTFYYPDTSFWDLVVASESLSLACGQLSHIEVLSAGCRPQGYDFDETRQLTATYDVCVPNLPRRLDFFATMGGPEALSPRPGE